MADNQKNKKGDNMKENEKGKHGSGLTQAELFGVDEIEKIERDSKTGVGTLPTKTPDPGFIPINVPYKQLAPEKQRRIDAFVAALDVTMAGVEANHEKGTPVGCSPLPWHWEEGGGGTINVLDANNNCVFDNINGGEVYSDRDWENVELFVACVNKFAESMTAEHLDRLRKKQVYGDENYDEDAALEEAKRKLAEKRKLEEAKKKYEAESEAMRAKANGGEA